MSTTSGQGEWTKELGTVWFICLFVGIFTGGVGLFITIPIAIAYTIKVIWDEITGKKDQPTESTHYQSYGGGYKIWTQWLFRIRATLLPRDGQSTVGEENHHQASSMEYIMI